MSAGAGLTDPGLTRPTNEDAFLVEPPLYAVADGMGGHRAGEIASRVAVSELIANAPRAADSKALARAVRAANRAVIESADRSHSRAGMGTTLTAAMVDGTHIAVAHVGDSRAYLLHAGKLARVTEDHSMVADLVRQGTITEEDARFHPQRSVITRALGSDPEMAADMYELDAEPGDRLLLATDGLTGMLPDDYVADLLLDGRDPADSAARLVEAANRAGGYDNITVVVVDIDDVPASDVAPQKGTNEARRRVAGRLLWVVAAIAFVSIAMWGAFSYASSRAYLIDEAGRVVVYRGIPGSFAGVTLHWRTQVTGVQTDALPLPLQVRLHDGIVFDGLPAALQRAADLGTQAAPSTPSSSTVTTFAP